MRKVAIALGVTLVLLLATAGIAGAITNGVPDGKNHPYVGLVLFYDESMVPLWRCSSSLISPTVLLTAGHCTDGAVRAQVWFDTGPITRDPAYTGGSCKAGGPYTGYPCAGGTLGIPYTNPDYLSPDNPSGGGNGLPAFSYRDTGIVELSKRVKMKTYAQLPFAGQIDTLKAKTVVDFVGYGVSIQEMSYPGENPYDRWTGPRMRMYAPSELVSGEFVHSAEYMKLALNPGAGSGGTCFGDSGGPDLLGGTNTVLAVNSYVTNSNCSGVGYSARVDIPEVLEWISEFLD
jgi:hypothetical protein